MSAGWPDWETLNAYVDGELDSAGRADVARAVAEDQETAEAVARLSRLKQAAQDAGGADAGERPAVDLPDGGRARRRAVWGTAAAVLVAAALGLTAGFWPRVSEPEWIGAAHAVHAGWAEDKAEDTKEAGTTSAVLLAAVEDFGRVPFVPDFSANKLSLASVRRAHLGETPVLHLGYRGTRGCRVSLLVLAEPRALTAELATVETATGPAHLWRAGGIGYALIASGMDEARLRVLAEAAHAATRERSQPDAETRTALRRSRAESQPCGA